LFYSKLNSRKLGLIPPLNIMQILIFSQPKMAVLRYIQNLQTTYLGIKSYRTSVTYLF